MRLTRLLEHAADLGLDVRWADLGDTRRGVYLRDLQLVVPHPGALADELGLTPHLVEAWRRWYGRRLAA